MFMMAMVLFAYILCSMILPLKVSWKYKAAMGLAVFVVAQKNGILRRLGGALGSCMSLCVYEHDALSTKSQPLLCDMKKIRDLI